MDQWLSGAIEAGAWFVGHLVEGRKDLPKLHDSRHRALSESPAAQIQCQKEVIKA